MKSFAPSSLSKGQGLRYLPGLVLICLLTMSAYLVAKLPGFHLLGALGVALLLGIAWRAAFGQPKWTRAGAALAAHSFLRIGVVFLGVRLDFGLLYKAGPIVLVLDLLIIAAGLLAMERLGKWLGVPRGLRLAVAVGSSICGASAIAAAAPIIKASDDEVSVAVSIVSLLGALGVVAYALLAPLLQMGVQVYGLMTGSTLHEMAHVLAAGAAGGAQALDLATLTKLTRVALLAPALLVIEVVLSRRDASAASTTPTFSAKRLPRPPTFLLGFLLVGAANSLGLIPQKIAAPLQITSMILIASAMVGIGLGVNFNVLKRMGGSASLAATIGFVLLVLVAGTYSLLFVH